MSVHYPLSPSGLSRVLACPGSFELCRDIPSRESRYAAEGTFLHGLVADCLQGTRLPEDYAEGDDVDLVQVCLDEFRRRAESLGSVDVLSIECTRESREVDELGGTADCVLIGPRHGDTVAVVMDWKFGAGIPVHAEGNVQLRAYGQLVVEAYPQVDFVEAVIVQPRIENGISSTVIYREDLAAFVDELQARLREDELTPGEHCRFCPAGDAGKCPALQQQAVAVFSDVPFA